MTYCLQNSTFFVLLTVNLSIILGNDQHDAQLHDFIIYLLCSCTYFEHYMLIIRRLNCINAASAADAISIQFNLLMVSI